VSEQQQPTPNEGRLMIVAAALLWSTGGAAVKSATLSAPQIAGGRAVVAAIALWLAIPAARIRPNKRILIAAIFYAITAVLFVFANTLTTAANTIFLQNTAPIWVMFLSAKFLGEVPTRAEKISVPIALLGATLFFLDDYSGGRLAGNLCAIAASFSYAALLMSYKKLASAEGTAATIYGALLVAIGTLPFGLAGLHPTPTDLGILLYLGVLQQAGAALCFIRGVRGVSALEGALLTLFEPLLSPVWAFIFVGEGVGWLGISGGSLILGATLWRIRAQRR
jgi:drug/metabolite transporter, DME family